MSNTGWPIIIYVADNDDEQGRKELFTTAEIANQCIKYWKDRGKWVFINRGKELLQ